MIETQNMKLTKIFVLLLAALLSLAAAPRRVDAAAPAAVNITVEGSPLAMPVPPIIIEGRTLVGVRSVGEAIGGTVDWDPVKRAATVTRRSDTVVLTLGKQEALVNGKPQTMDVPAQLVGDRTMVPLRFIAEALGGAVEWNPDTKTANILRKPTFITAMSYLRDVGKTSVVLTLSEPPASIKPQATDDSLTLDLYPAVIKTDQPTQLPFDALMKAVGLQADGRTVHLQAQLWNPPTYRYALSPDGTQLTIEFDYTVTGIQYQQDGRIPVIYVAATGRLNYNTIDLADPNRLVLDLAGTHFSPLVPATMDAGPTLVSKVRTGLFTRNPDTARIVLETSRKHPYEIVSTDLGLLVRFVPRIEALTTQKLQGKTRLTFATSLPVDAKVTVADNKRAITIEIPQAISSLTNSVTQIADGTIDTVTVAPGSAENSTLITVALPYYLGHNVVSKNGDSAVILEIITSPVYGKRIWIDAGHGKIPGGANDPGTIGTTYKTREVDMNLQVALELQKRLQDAGAIVFMTRTGPEGIDFQQRPDVVNAQKPPIDAFISIHHNSMDGGPAIRGTETYYWSAYPKSAALAAKVHPAVVKALGFPDRKVRNDQGFVVIKKTLAPAILVELGYLSNAAEEKAIAEPGVAIKTYPGKAAEGLKNGLFYYFWNDIQPAAPR